MQSEVIESCKTFMREKILQPAKFRGFEEQRKTLRNLVERAVWNNDSNSALLIGPPGSGKTTLVSTVLQELTQETDFLKKAQMILMNGNVHMNDRESLKCICKEMELENVVDDRVTGSFADNMALVLSAWKNRAQKKALIFILEELDPFLYHHNQSLLYNLFDMAHKNETAMFVLGVTIRFDVMERMEKRVRSRFSYRNIYLLPANNAVDLKTRIGLCRDWLSIDTSSFSNSICKGWNKHINKLLAENETAYNCIKRLYEMQSSEDSTKELLLKVISRLSEDKTSLSGEDFESALEEVTSDGWLQILDGFSTLEICLVIAMKQLGDVYQGDPVNFEMVYSRYLKFAKNHSSFEDCNRNTVIKAFEHLEALEIILPVTGHGVKTQSQYQLYHFQLTAQQVKSAVKRHEDLPTEVQQWAEINLL